MTPTRKRADILLVERGLFESRARAQAAIAYLGQVSADGLDPSDYPVPDFASLTDPVALAKALTAYAKENPALVFKAGVVEGRVISLAELVSLASLPSREALLSKVLFLINSPAQRVATAVSAVARNLVVTLQQAVKEKKFSEPAGG